jgi:hypothetical protein
MQGGTKEAVTGVLERLRDKIREDGDDQFRQA